MALDPLEFVWRYRDPLDQEVVALLGALLAYGNVRQIRRSLEGALERLRGVADTPYGAVERLGGSQEQWGKIFSGFVHRFTTGADLAFVLSQVARTYEKAGSLGAAFLSGDAPAGREGVAFRMNRWFGGYLERKAPDGRERNLRFLLAHPRSGAACKRFCMLLRWMGRKDELDPGLWAGAGLSPADLVLPLDTHLLRISRELGLTSSKQATWRAAVEATEALAFWDPRDPLRFDFALCRLGMLGHR